MTWENADGGFFRNDNMLVIAQESMVRGVYKPVPAERGRGLLFHEFGHALDVSLGLALTRDEDIVQAWRREADVLRAMRFATVDELYDRNYFTLPEPRGVHETIAELMARMQGYRTAESLDALDYFKETLKALRQRLGKV